MTTKFTYLKAADKKQPHLLNLAVLQPGTYFYVSQANVQKMYDLLRVIGWRGFVDGTNIYTQKVQGVWDQRRIVVMTLVPVFMLNVWIRLLRQILRILIRSYQW